MSTTVVSAAARGPRPRSVNISLWVAQLALAAVFGASGAVKVFATDWYQSLNAWPADVPYSLIVFIGTLELAAAFVLVLPQRLRFQPQLTVSAALGLMTIMILAAGFHSLRAEWIGLPFNLGLGGLAAWVAWGRSRPIRLRARAQ